MTGNPGLHGSVEAQIAAPPERVYELVADVTRMGEWSPECRGCEWQDGSTGHAVGARFIGSNEANGNEWTTTCEVVTAELGREFAFAVLIPDRPGLHRTLWQYRFEPCEGGTRAVESFTVVTPPDVPPGTAPDAVREFAEMRERMLREHMTTTLERLRAAAEAAPADRAAGPAAGPVAP